MHVTMCLMKITFMRQDCYARNWSFKLLRLSVWSWLSLSRVQKTFSRTGLCAGVELPGGGGGNRPHGMCDNEILWSLCFTSGIKNALWMMGLRCNIANPKYETNGYRPLSAPRMANAMRRSVMNLAICLVTSPICSASSYVGARQRHCNSATKLFQMTWQFHTDIHYSCTGPFSIPLPITPSLAIRQFNKYKSSVFNT